MDFNTKYPKSQRPPVVGAIVEDRIVWTGRIYECAECGKVRTGFRLDSLSKFPPTPCCSEECKIVGIQKEDMSPGSSEGERLPDSQKVAGSSPAPGTTLWEQVLLHMLEVPND